MEKGFTLIELMIVVAIIAVLAAISIPMYVNYINKAQVTRVYAELSAVKTAVDEIISRGGQPSPFNIDSVLKTTRQEWVGWQGSDLVNNKVTTTSEHSLLSKGLVITKEESYTMLTAVLGNHSNASLTNTKIHLVRENGSWRCVVDGSQAEGFRTNYAPTNCALEPAPYLY